MIAIKDFEMPKSCEQCDLYIDDSCGITGNCTNWLPEEQRAVDCPLVEINVEDYKAPLCEDVIHGDFSGVLDKE